MLLFLLSWNRQYLKWFHNYAQKLIVSGWFSLFGCRTVVVLASASLFGESCEGSRGGQATSYPGGWRDEAELLREPDGSCGLEMENSQWWVFRAHINIAVRWFFFSPLRIKQNFLLFSLHIIISTRRKPGGDHVFGRVCRACVCVCVSMCVSVCN